MKNFTVSVAVILFHFSFANVSSISTKNLIADKSFLVQELNESTFVSYETNYSLCMYQPKIIKKVTKVEL